MDENYISVGCFRGCSWAVEYYSEQSYPEDTKGRYLYTYGLLQALFVQQDAVESINAVITDAQRVDWHALFPEAYNIREMRNDVVGHPTNRNNRKVFVRLIQPSMSKNGFSYMKGSVEKRTNEIIAVNLVEAIDTVARCINCVLADVVKRMDEEFEEYINSHRGRKMKEIFLGLQYAKEKALCEDYLADCGYNNTKKMVQKCEEELDKRYTSVDAHESFKYVLDGIHEIYELIDDGLPRIPPDLRPKMRNALLENLFEKMEKLRLLCEEVDAYFECGGKDLVNTDKEVVRNKLA